MNGRRLSPQEIAERFGSMKRDHERQVERSKARKAKISQAKDTRSYLDAQQTIKVGPSLGDTIRDAYREGYRVRNPRGHFMGLPKD